MTRRDTRRGLTDTYPFDPLVTPDSHGGMLSGSGSLATERSSIAKSVGSLL